MVVDLSGPQQTAGEGGLDTQTQQPEQRGQKQQARPEERQASGSADLVDGVGPVLGLQAEGAVPAVDGASLPQHRAVQVVGCVELEPRLAGEHLQHTPTGCVVHSIHTHTHTHTKYRT